MSNPAVVDSDVQTATELFPEGSVGAVDDLSRRAFLTGAGKLVLGGSLVAAGMKGASAQAAVPAGSTGSSMTQPNIILIINDQERYPQHWPENWAVENLPAHNRLAANGLTFRHAFCNTAMCSPSRATLFTGLHPAQHTVTRTLTGKCPSDPADTPDEPTLPQNIQTMGRMLGSAGYNVIHKGKWHMTMTDEGDGEPVDPNEMYLPLVR